MEKVVKRIVLISTFVLCRLLKQLVYPIREFVQIADGFHLETWKQY